jgi:hypothetical protein
VDKEDTVTIHYLVVANRTLGGQHLVDTVTTRSREGATIHVTVPATPLEGGNATNGGTPEEIAQQRLDEELRRLEEAGVKATGNVGPADPMAAIREQMDVEHFTGVIISTLHHTVSRWLHLDLPHRVVREFRVPVEWLESRTDDDNPSVVHLAVPPTNAQVSNEAGIPRLRTH